MKKNYARTLSQISIAALGEIVDEQDSTSSWINKTPAPTAPMMSWPKHAVDVIIDIVMNAITCQSHNKCLEHKSSGPRITKLFR